jgi:ABC-type amino acid transport substrate-binding protein
MEFIPLLSKYPNLVPVHDAGGIHYLSWVTSKENLELSLLINKALSYLHKNGVIKDIFKDVTGFSYRDYEKLLNLAPNQHIFEMDINLEEQDYIDQLRVNGGLKVAVFRSNESYRVSENGDIVGFDYHMALEFANTLGLDIDIKIIDKIDDFWKEEEIFDTKVVTDKSISYTPGLLKEVQMYMGGFGINEWRSRLVKFIPLHPAGLVLFGKNADNITSFSQLDGKVFGASQGSFQEEVIKGLMKQHNIDIKIVGYESSDQNAIFNLIMDGTVDYAIDGSVFIARGMQNLNQLTVSPLPISRSLVAWAVESNNFVLEGLVRKFIDLSLANRTFHKYWDDAYGIPFEVYLEMVE